MRRIIPYLAAVLLLASCEKVLEFDINSSERQLVLNAVPSADSTLTVNFAYSEFFLDTTFDHPVSGADMVVNVNGTDYRPVRQQGSNYFFDYTLKEDDQLAIRVNTNGQQVTAQTYVPRQPQVADPVCYVDSSGTFNLLMVNFTLQDHPGYKDYYRIYVQQRDSGLYHRPYYDSIEPSRAYDTIDTVLSTYFCCFDNKLTAGNAAASQALGGYFYSQLLTTDANIDGESHNVSLIVILTRDTNEVQPYRHDYTLHVETVTPDRYQYLQDQAQASSLMQLITEPAPVHSNVTGALGIFAGNAHKRFPLQVIERPGASWPDIPDIPDIPR